jgi:hypothetical protein
VALYTAAMDKVRPGREGTDFTIQIVITHLSGLIIAVMSGKFADVFGYAFLFFVQMLLSAATLILLIMFKRKLFNAEQGNNI